MTEPGFTISDAPVVVKHSTPASTTNALSIDRAFTEEQYELISLGVIPEAMQACERLMKKKL